MKIAIGGDHAGYELKKSLISSLQQEGHTVKDFGPYKAESCDYPDFAHPVSRSVKMNECELGILICGSGNGVAIAANKHPDIRAAICWLPELAVLAKEHNNANLLCIPARYVSKENAIAICTAFLSSKFLGGRHETRVNKINI